MRLGRRDVAALALVAAIVCGTVWFVRRIHIADEQGRAAVAGIVQGELAPVAIALVLLPSVYAWWARGSTRPRRGSLRFASRYRAFVNQVTRTVDVRGLVGTPEYPIDLDTVFVDVRVVPRPAGDVSTGLLSAGLERTRERQSIWDFVGDPAPALLALIGGPGTGKTTLLRHIARSLASTPRRHRRRVPVLLELRRHAADIVADLQAPLWQLWRTSIGELAEREPRNWLRRHLERGNCVVLFDGLDEVPTPSDDRMVRDWVERQVHQYPDNDYLITSRPHDYRIAPITAATTLETRSLTDAQVRDFVHGMYHALPPSSGQPEAAAVDLLGRLSTRPDLYEFTANPLLLTMMVLAHRQGGALPENRAELYADVCTSVLSRRSSSQRWGVDLDVETKQAALATLAFTMTRTNVNEVSGGDAVAALRPALPGEVPAERFLGDASANGLLIESRRGWYAFAHRSFQEYLTVRHIVDKGLDQVLIEAVCDPWWRETQLMYATGSDPSALLRACVRVGTADTLSLAFECAAAATHVEPDVQIQLDGAVAAAFSDDADPQYRRLIASILLRHRLNPSLPAANGRRVYSLPVPQDVYWLFLHDTGNPLPDGPPPAPESPAPVTGIWPTDAAAFVIWANGLDTDSGAPYSLTTKTDLLALDHQLGLSVFTERAGDHRFWGPHSIGGWELERWTTNGGQDRLRVSTAEVRARIVEDADVVSELLGRLCLLHARGLCRAISSLDLPGDGDQRPAYSEEYLVPRAAARRYARGVDRTLAFMATATDDGPTVVAAREALETFTRTAAPADLAHVESTLSSTKTAGITFAVLQGCLDGQSHFDTSLVIDLAANAFRRMRAAEGAAVRQAHSRGRSPEPRRGGDEVILDRFIDNDRWGLVGIEHACHGSVSAVLGDGMALMLTRGRLLSTISATDRLMQRDDFAAGVLRFQPEHRGIGLGALRSTLEEVRTYLLDAAVPRALGSLLIDRARPIFNRQQQCTSADAAAARLCALTIAIEAADRNLRDLEDDCRQVAAGVTLLQDRASGVRTGEALFLAVS